jgi:hypothetical protein
MLQLDSPRWSKLEHAYGYAAVDTSAPTGWSATGGFHGYQDISNTVQCLERLSKNSQRLPLSEWEPWETLVSCLCHQGTIYSASFAAVPHIVEIGLRSAAIHEIDVGFFLLPTIIEQARLSGQQPQVEEDILRYYQDAIHRLHDLAHAVRNHSWPPEYAATIAAATTVSKGHLQLSKCFLECAETRTVEAILSWLYGPR